MTEQQAKDAMHTLWFAGYVDLLQSHWISVGFFLANGFDHFNAYRMADEMQQRWHKEPSELPRIWEQHE